MESFGLNNCSHIGLVRIGQGRIGQGCYECHTTPTKYLHTINITAIVILQLTPIIQITDRRSAVYTSMVNTVFAALCVFSCARGKGQVINAAFMHFSISAWKLLFHQHTVGALTYEQVYIRLQNIYSVSALTSVAPLHVSMYCIQNSNLCWL